MRGWADEQVCRIEARDAVGVAAATVLRAGEHGCAFEFWLLRSKADLANTWNFELQVETNGAAGETIPFSVVLGPAGATVTEGPIWDNAPDDSVLPAVLLHPERTVIESDGTLLLRGWAISTDEIAGFRLNGSEVPIASGLSRPDVARIRPRYPNAEMAGFQLRHRLDDASAPLLLEVLTISGLSQLIRLCPERPTRPAQAADPRRMLKLFCDEAVLRSDAVMLVSGWAVSPTGVRDVRVFLGDLPLGEAEFGLPREDVGEEFPAIPMARFSGFRARFSLDPEVPKPDQVRVVADNTLADEVQVLRKLELRAAPEPVPAPAPPDPERFRIEVDSPAIMDGQAIEAIGKRLTVDGWTLVDGGVESIDVVLDDQPIGRAHYGIVRHDVARAFPHREDAVRSGYAFHFPPPCFGRACMLLRSAFWHGTVKCSPARSGSKCATPTTREAG